ncbi:Putative fluoride ion transporter CrcB [Roseovarius albus]|uniref:Fluoride-specific ion channel FluC n=1 Tax=Roseovarius albus TaxID=1247867 RepID=A0A1X6Z8P1_9RHOB|nr:CrcB family protein [Roseovarius albus]SLN44226.1 Putative fluoride ion transporter CrcB [Roseovarius albus]
MSAFYLHALFALGGGLGAVIRHLVSQLITHELPFATMIVNVLGCFLLGAWISHIGPSTELLSTQERQLVFGFCGGFTTFSSFAYQSLQLHRERTFILAGANIGLSLILCWGAFWLGLVALS